MDVPGAPRPQHIAPAPPCVAGGNFSAVLGFALNHGEAGLGPELHASDLLLASASRADEVFEL